MVYKSLLEFFFKVNDQPNNRFTEDIDELRFYKINHTLKYLH